MELDGHDYHQKESRRSSQWLQRRRTKYDVSSTN